MRGSRNLKGKKFSVANPSSEQGLQPSPFSRVSRVNALDSLPEVDEHEDVALYDPRKGFLDSYKEGDTPKFFGESSAFTFSRTLGKDTIQVPPGRRLEYWTIPSVRLHV